MAYAEQYIDKLRKSGLRPTKQRIKICEVLFRFELPVDTSKIVR